MNRLGINLWNWISCLEEIDVPLIRKVSALGFTAVELPMTTPVFDGMDRIMGAIREENMTASFCLCMPMAWDISSNDKAVRERAIVYLKDCLDTAEKYGVTILCGAIYGAAGKRNFLLENERLIERNYAVEGIRAAADYAKRKDIFLGIEPINRYRTSMVNSVEQGLKLVDDIGLNNVGILFDTYHANIEETNIPQALEDVLRRQRLIHFHASENNRGAAGTGHIPWETLAALLKRYNYTGHITMETFCAKGPDPYFFPLAENQDILAQTGINNMKRIFS